MNAVLGFFRRLWKPPVADTGDRAVFVRMLLMIVWLPFQITLSLIFATGGIFFVLVLGLVFGPFVGLYFLIRKGLEAEDRQAKAEGE